MEQNERDGIRISVVIPVYNTEKYLREALDSVLTQDVPGMEVICVDDGSTDRSPEILEEYAAKDGRVILLRGKNRGCGAARNTGLAEASGKYIYFMDSDDVLKEGALEYMLGESLADDLDVLLFGAEVMSEEGVDPETVRAETGYFRRKEKWDGIYGGAELMKLMKRKNDYNVSIPLRVSKRSFLEENGLRFKEISYEDELFSFQEMLAARRVKCADRKLYVRRLRAGSLMTSVLRAENVRDFFYIFREMQSCLAEDGGEKDPDLDAIAASVLRVTRRRYRKLSEEERRRADEGDDPESELFRAYVTNHERRYAWEQKTVRAEKENEKLGAEAAELVKKLSELEKDLSEHRKNEAELEQRGEALRRERDRLLGMNREITESVSFRAGRALTWVPRKLRDKLK